MSRDKTLSFDVNKNSKQKIVLQEISEKIFSNYEHDLFVRNCNLPNPCDVNMLRGYEQPLFKKSACSFCRDCR
jgi:hypothetical protein